VARSHHIIKIKNEFEIATYYQICFYIKQTRTNFRAPSSKKALFPKSAENAAKRIKSLGVTRALSPFFFFKWEVNAGVLEAYREAQTIKQITKYTLKEHITKKRITYN